MVSDNFLSVHFFHDSYPSIVNKTFQNYYFSSKIQHNLNFIAVKGQVETSLKKWDA